MKVVCGWHPRYFGTELLLHGDPKDLQVSHGICDECRALVEKDAPFQAAAPVLESAEGLPVTRCRDCGKEILWAVVGTQRIPLDPAVRVYRVTSALGDLSAAKVSQVVGMPDASLASHHDTCRARRLRV